MTGSGLIWSRRDLDFVLSSRLRVDALLEQSRFCEHSQGGCPPPWTWQQRLPPMAWANTEKTPEVYAETEDKPAGCVTSVTLTVDEAVIRDR
jgi:hypothetical protein